MAWKQGLKIYFAHNFRDSDRPGRLGDIGDSAIDAFLRLLGSHGVTVCDPAETPVPRSDFVERFNYCIREIRTSDVVLIDARSKLSFGVGAEAMFAKAEGIPVFAVCP